MMSTASKSTVAAASSMVANAPTPYSPARDSAASRLGSIAAAISMRSMERIALAW